MLRINQGKFKNRKLQSLDGLATRPTSSKTRQMVVNSLVARYDLAEFTLVDLFAGVGALALELYSAGGKEMLLVESSPAAAKLLKANLSHLGLEKDAGLWVQDSLNFLQRGEWAQGPYLFLLDPPYGQGLAEAAMTHLASLALGGSLVVWEHGIKEEFSPPASWECFKSKRFGIAQVEFYEIL